MKTDFLQFGIDTTKTVLSAKSLFYKTENLIKQTKYVSNINLMLTKLCEVVILNFSNIKEIVSNGEHENINCYNIKTSDNKFSFMFKLGFQIKNITKNIKNTDENFVDDNSFINLNDEDIIFFDYSQNSENLNLRIEEYLKDNKTLKVEISCVKNLVKEQEFNKLYLISNVSNINLPKLTNQQSEIVETVDKNVLVQGVAGSGKTNICIDKIIFTACKNYSGKVLYTTFSRGLLVDTKLKVENYKKDLEQILFQYKQNNIVFLDDNHKKALENKLGIYFFSDDDNKIFEKIERIINYLENKVDYYLIEDIYKNKFNDNKTFVSQNYFINIYSNNLQNHQIEKSFNKLSKYSKEIIYKEIYGMIFGFYSLKNNEEIMPLQVYVQVRKNSFSTQECEAIYQIAQDFKKHCEKNNLLDNNSASRLLINKLNLQSSNSLQLNDFDNKFINNNFDYSLSIIDEVQDYTQVNLCLFKKLSLKLFCVGDASQMINPSYFTFGYLKNLLYDKDITDVKELKHNYRNSKKIEDIINNLNLINISEFGTHNFVLNGTSIDNGVQSRAVYVISNGDNFISSIVKNNFDNFTIVVNNSEQKQELQKILKNQEVLTVSEIKGLERSTIVTYNLLTSNSEKWKTLENNKVNHKQADENSVYRYYYNLFYVGLTRAKQNIFVVENQNIKQFSKFFKDNFENVIVNKALEILSNIVSKAEFSQQEFIERVKEFIKLEQFDNAKFTANKIKDDNLRIDMLRTIEVYENFIHFGKYREAGIKFWEYGLIEQAKQQFTLSNDDILIELVDKCSKETGKDLNIEIVNYYLDVKDNELAKTLILETIKKDISNLKQSFNDIGENLKRSKI